MKQVLMTAAAIALGAAGMAAADPVQGTWKSPTNSDGAYIQVTMKPCGAEVCGTISKVVNGDNAIVGKRMIWGMKPAGGGVYKGGRVWAPDDDKTYRGKLTLSGNALKVEGCVLGGAVCRGEAFSRVN